jgi:hypothetical protein
MSSSESSKHSKPSKRQDQDRYERIDLCQLAKDLAQDEWERLVYRPPDWPPERFIDYSYERLGANE